MHAVRTVNRTADFFVLYLKLETESILASAFQQGAGRTSLWSLPQQLLNLFVGSLCAVSVSPSLAVKLVGLSTAPSPDSPGSPGVRGDWRRTFHIVVQTITVVGNWTGLWHPLLLGYICMALFFFCVAFYSAALRRQLGSGINPDEMFAVTFLATGIAFLIPNNTVHFSYWSRRSLYCLQLDAVSARIHLLFCYQPFAI